MGNKISVLICAYNYGRYLPQCLTSVMRQTRPPEEVIVVDDGSTDDTPDVARRFPSVRYKRLDHQGKAAAFNWAFKASTGDIVCHLDADDYWSENKLERLVDVLPKKPAGGLTHDAFYVDSAGQFLYGSQFPTDGTRKRCCLSLTEALFSCFLYRPRRVGSKTLGVANTVCVWREAVTDLFPLPLELELAVDGALILGAARRGLIHVPEKLSTYRHHGSNFFVSDPRTREYQCRLYSWALQMPGINSRRDKDLLRTLLFEAEAHFAMRRSVQSISSAYKAVQVNWKLLRLGLVPHWKHLGLPVACLLRWGQIRERLRDT